MSSKSKYINSILEDCVKNIELVENEKKFYAYNSIDDYNKTLEDELGDFSISISDRKKINVIIYNPNNSDGAVSGAIAYHYIKDKVPNAEILLIGIGEGKGKQLMKKRNELEGKNVLIVDLEFKQDMIGLADICNKIYVIDNHKIPRFKLPKNIKLVSSDQKGHASCGLVWKVFYPKRNVPESVKLIDLGDSKKKTMRGISYGHFFGAALTYRFTRNPKIPKSKWDSGEVFNDMWEVIDGKKASLWKIIGWYMSEVEENLKEQIAQNAQIRDFQGFKVGVLNFLDPALYKKVGRQILTNNEGKIDFAVLWGFEHRSNRYKVAIICYHDPKKCKVNMHKLGTILGEKGGNPSGGGGFGYTGNFYWNKDKNHDIWDLFEKNILSAKERKEVMMS